MALGCQVLQDPLPGQDHDRNREGPVQRPAGEDVTVEVGAEITLRQGFDLKTVVVLGLSEERRCFAEASKLYQETPESIARREKDAEARRINAYFSPRPDEKPDKKQRRELLRLKNSFGDEE